MAAESQKHFNQFFHSAALTEDAFNDLALRHPPEISDGHPSFVVAEVEAAQLQNKQRLLLGL